MIIKPLRPSNCRIKSAKGIVITAGAWSGPLLAELLKEEAWESVLTPRKGHLLEIEWPDQVPALKHGLMEIGYANVSA